MRGKQKERKERRERKKDGKCRRRLADDDVSSLFSFSLGKKKKGFAQEERAGERASGRARGSCP